MINRCENIYRNARKSAGITQRQAAEKLFISERSIADYEAGKTIPADDVVCKMIEMYQVPKLGYLHLKKSTEVGVKYLPDILLDDFALSVLRFQKEHQDIVSIKDAMFEIAYDGKVNEDEKEDWTKIKKEVEEIAGAAMALMFVE